MVDRVGATDEWVQEAVMSDFFSSDELVRQKLPQQKQKDTGSPQAQNNRFSNRAEEALETQNVLNFDNTVW